MRMRLLCIATLLLAQSVMPLRAAAQQGSESLLTNAAVIKLVRVGFKERTVIAIIRSRPNRFNLDPDHLIELKRSGVGEDVIIAMLAQNDSAFVASDDWDGDSLFNNSNGTMGQRAPADPQGGTDIFGSSGGSKGETRGRGMSGSSQGERLTTGTATVRIVRPPSESGGTQAKLERTPALDNDAIIGLVEAGFSEGTIIKRIHDSPVEFDLSSNKLENLRKRRVSEPIIAAMSAAMEDETTTPVRPREN